MQPPCDHVIQDEALIDTIEALKTLLDPVQMRIVKTLQQRPYSLEDLAEAINIPPGRVLYHVRHLIDNDMVSILDLDGDSPTYALRARNFIVDRRLLMPDNPLRQEVIDTVSYLTFDATRKDLECSIRAGVVGLENPVPSEDALMARRIIYSLTPERARWLQTQLRDLLLDTFVLSQEDCGEKHDYNVTVVCYPTTFVDGECDEAIPSI